MVTSGFGRQSDTAVCAGTDRVARCDHIACSSVQGKNDHSIYVDAHALQTLSPLPYHLIADSRADIQDQRAADAQIHQ